MNEASLGGNINVRLLVSGGQSHGRFSIPIELMDIASK
jgi:hypothetical protein